MTKTHLMKNYLLKMAQSLYITEIYKLWRPQSLYVTEIYKLWRLNFTKLKISPELFNEIVFARETESHYNLRWRNDFRVPSIRTVYHGLPKIWNILLDEIKQ